MGVELEEAEVAACVLPVFGTTPAPAGGGVPAPVPQALRRRAAASTTNMETYKFFLIFLLLFS
jgi:hypothetical protein